MNRARYLLLAVLLAAACSRGVDHGLIVAKRITPPSSYEWVETRCIVYNSKGLCSGWMPVVHHEYVPEHRQLLLRDEKNHSGWHTVSAENYETARVGESYPRPR